MKRSFTEHPFQLVFVVPAILALTKTESERTTRRIELGCVSNSFSVGFAQYLLCMISQARRNAAPLVRSNLKFG